MTWDSQRRWFLRTAALAASLGVAGCAGESDQPEAETEAEPTETEVEPTETEVEPTETEAETPSQDDPEPESERPSVDQARGAVDDWLSNTSNYDGEMQDSTGKVSQAVRVGADSPTGDNFAFDPPALEVREGTTVEWTWSGDGGAHSVTEKYGAFDSGSPTENGSSTFSHRFDEAGVYLYRCKNHGGAAGMRGAVVVSEQPTLSGYPKVDNWLEDEDFDGVLDDYRDEDSVRIETGTSGGGGHFAFDPNAVVVDQGTEVVFEWTGRGGAHSIEWKDGDYSNSDSTGSARHTHSVTMDQPGVYRYRCGAHAPFGGRGAIVVL